MNIRLITTYKKRFLPLLLLADEQESMIDRYLERGELFVMYDTQEAIAAAVVTNEGNGVYELKNLAVAPSYQRKGYGRQMVEYLCRYYADVCHTLLVGTGESKQIITFYESCGFTYSHTVADFFTCNYDHPIVEDGKVLKDMIYFRKSLIELRNLPPSERSDDLIHTLVELWDASVRASYHFLAKEDIRRLTPFVGEAIREVETLLVMYQGNQPVAFMGVENQKTEMLFVAPDCFGNGLGKQLICVAIKDYQVLYVDVNEQNPQAAGFYRHFGFRTFERTETDEQGNPFPILKMKLEKTKVIPSILLVHGGPGAVGSLHSMTEYMSRHFQVLECLQTKYTIEELKKELITQIRMQACPPVTLIGHSWGAWLSILVAVEQPEAVRQLILIGCPPFEEHYVPLIRENRLNRLSESEKERFKYLLASLEREATEEAMQQLETYIEQTDNYRLRAVSAKGFQDARMYASIWTEASALRKRGEWRRLLPQIACPVIILHGKQDPHPYQGVVGPLDEAGITYRLHILECCGHTPFLEVEAKENFYALLNDYL